MSLQQIAREVLDLVDRGEYVVDGRVISIRELHERACLGSKLYREDSLQTLRDELPSGSSDKVNLEVVDGTTQTVAQSLAATIVPAQGHKLALLNFASARRPGGGFLRGAKAQEEDLCRCSSLYSALVNHPEYYETNLAQASHLYTDTTIFTPAVPFFKTRGTGDLLETPFLASVITTPAPNTRAHLADGGNPADLKACFERRWRTLLAVAKAEGVTTLLLGAWGCGAFGGDPEVAAHTAKTALIDCAPAFERIVFAIPGKGKQSAENLAVFRRVLAN